MIKKNVKLCLLFSIISLQSSSHLFSMNDDEKNINTLRQTLNSCKGCDGKGWIENGQLTFDDSKLSPKECTYCASARNVLYKLTKQYKIDIKIQQQNPSSLQPQLPTTLYKADTACEVDEKTTEIRLYKSYQTAKRAMDNLIKDRKAKRYLKEGRELDDEWASEQEFNNTVNYVEDPLNYELFEEGVWKSGQDKPSTFEKAIHITITTRDTFKNLKNAKKAYRDYVELKEKHSGRYSPRMTQDDLDQADWEVKHGQLPKRLVKEKSRMSVSFSSQNEEEQNTRKITAKEESQPKRQKIAE